MLLKIGKHRTWHKKKHLINDYKSIILCISYMLLLFSPMPWTGAGAFENLYCPFPHMSLGNTYSVLLGQRFQTIGMDHKIRFPVRKLQESHLWPLQTPRVPRWDPRSIICHCSFPMLETHLKGCGGKAESLHQIARESSEYPLCCLLLLLLSHFSSVQLFVIP